MAGRKGRGSKNSDRQLSLAPLLGTRLLTGASQSRATTRNVDRARKVLENFAKNHSSPDPVNVTIHSSDLVINLLHRYCKMGTKEALSDDSMCAMIQGLRIVYEENGHYHNYTVNHENNTAQGNPLTGNANLVALRRAHRVSLSRFGRVSLRARPITVDLVCSLAEKFWHGGTQVIGQHPHPQDIELHAVLVVGLNIGLRFDEISKLTVGHMTINGGNVQMTIAQSIKNSTVRRDYVLRDWPGNSSLRHSTVLDPVTCLLAWLSIRGSVPGHLFCDIRQTRNGSVIEPRKAWGPEKFNSVLQDRLKLVGVGEDDAKMYTGHSLKRGCVQLYRSLNVRDENIMELIQMRGDNAYHNYCAAYNDCAPKDLPRFTTIDDFLKHSNSIVKESGLQNEEDLEAHLSEIFP